MKKGKLREKLNENNRPKAVIPEVKKEEKIVFKKKQGK